MLELKPVKGSLEDLERRVKESPQSAEAHCYLANYYRTQQRDIHSAKHEYEKAISLKKEFPEAYIGLAECFWAEEQKETAILKLEEAVGIIPESALLFGKLGSFLKDSGEHKNKVGNFKEAVGEFKDAVKYLTKALKYEKDEKKAKRWGEKLREVENILNIKKCPYCNHDIVPECDLCPECQRYITVCSNCKYPNALFRRLCLSCRKPLPSPETWIARGDSGRSSYIASDRLINALSRRWFYPFQSAIRHEILPNIPSPVIAGDIVIIPNPDDHGKIKSLLGLSINSGQRLWEWQVGHELSYTCAPVPMKEYLYIPSHGYLRKRPINSQSAQSHIMHSDEKVIPSEYRLPLPCKHKDKHFIVLSSDKSISIYNLDNEQSTIVKIPFQKQGDNIAGIVWNGEKVIILSKRGEILSLTEDLNIQSLRLLKNDINDIKVCSPPCSFKKDIYFEFMHQEDSKRRVCAFAPDIDKTVEIELEDEEGCSMEHFHWKFPPLTYEDGIILTSDLYSRLYTAKREEEILIVVAKELDISPGIINISQELSAVMGSYLFSSTGGFLFYVNLNNPEEKGLMDIGSQVIAQPAISQRELFLFLCIDGLHCYGVV